MTGTKFIAAFHKTAGLGMTPERMDRVVSGIKARADKHLGSEISRGIAKRVADKYFHQAAKDNKSPLHAVKALQKVSK